MKAFVAKAVFVACVTVLTGQIVPADVSYRNADGKIDYDSLDYEQFGVLCTDVIGKRIDAATDRFRDRVENFYENTKVRCAKTGKGALFLKKIGPYIERQRDLILGDEPRGDEIFFTDSEQRFAAHVDTSIEPLKQSFEEELRSVQMAVDKLSKVTDRLCSIHLERNSADAEQFSNVDILQFLPEEYRKYVEMNLTKDPVVSTKRAANPVDKDSGQQKDFPAGVTKKITCKAQPDVEYELYLPSKYDPNRQERWPVLLAIANKENYQDFMAKCAGAAEKNNWIVAMCSLPEWDKWQERFPKGRKKLLPMVEDVLARYPINKRRCYAAGVWDGVYLACWLDEGLPYGLAGTLLCSGNPLGYSIPVPSYGLFGTKAACWNGMVYDFPQKGDDVRLRFYSGVCRPASRQIFTAVTWLNAKYLAKKGDADEIIDFSEMLFSEIEASCEGDPFFAYENACILASVKKAPHALEAKHMAAELKKNDYIKTCVAALDDLEDFTNKYMKMRWHIYTEADWSKGSRPQRDAKKLADEYADTPMFKVFRDFERKP